MVVRGRKIVDIVEVTGPNVPKKAQLAKTTRIRENPPVFVRDPQTRELLEIPREVEERVKRVP